MRSRVCLEGFTGIHYFGIQQHQSHLRICWVPQDVAQTWHVKKVTGAPQTRRNATKFRAPYVKKLKTEPQSNRTIHSCHDTHKAGGNRQQGYGENLGPSGLRAPMKSTTRCQLGLNSEVCKNLYTFLSSNVQVFSLV